MELMLIDPKTRQDWYWPVELRVDLAKVIKRKPESLEWCRKDTDNREAFLEAVSALPGAEDGLAKMLKGLFAEAELSRIGAEEFAVAVQQALERGGEEANEMAARWQKIRELRDAEILRQKKEEERRQREEAELHQREEAERLKKEEAELRHKEEKAPDPPRGEVAAEEALRLFEEDDVEAEEEARIEEKARASGHATLALPGGAEMEMVWCPAGTFMMGSPAGERGRDDDEKQHLVTLTEGFWMARYPVTQEQWESVMGYNPSVFKGSDLPVVCVDYHECQDFCLKTYSRLPTEAEWEYACRAGSQGPYSHFFLSRCGWFSENSKKRLHSVGMKKPNRWGLYDMHGNVWEWCADWYGAYPAGETTDPTGPDEGKGFVLRGGSAWCVARRCRSAFRGWRPPGSWDDDRGFRPVCDFVT